MERDSYDERRRCGALCGVGFCFRENEATEILGGCGAMGNGCMSESKLACTHAGGGTAKHERRDAISAYPTPFWICLFLFGLIAAMAKRKNKMKADKENVPAQKRQKQEEPWASECEQKEKGDTHKWGYASASYFRENYISKMMLPLARCFKR